MYIYIYYKELAHMIMGAVKSRPRITNDVSSNSSLEAREHRPKTVRQRERILSYLNFYSIQGLDFKAFKGLDEA